MNLSRVALVAIAIALLTVACNKTDQVSTGTPQPSRAASPAVNASPDEFAATRATYAKSCGGCHGANGEGGTAEVNGKKIKAPPLRSGHALKHTDPDFVKQITKGGDGMPAFSDKISEKGIQDLVRFIRRDFQAGNSPQ